MVNKGWMVWMLGIIWPLTSAEAQAPFTVSDPVIERYEQLVRINYDFPESDSNEYFAVSLFITDGEGRFIQTRALSGDIGIGVPGGNHKEILWDPQTDRIFMNEQLFFQVAASRFIPAREASGGQVDLSAGSSVGNGSGSTALRSASYANLSSASRSSSFTRTGIVVQSLLIPGLGLSRISGKPHWLRAVAGYGCIAGAVYFNIKAFNTYESIIDYSDFDLQQQHLQRSIREDNLSEGFAYAAAGIWVADLIWTIAGSPAAIKKSNSNWRKEVRNQGRSISLRPLLDPFSLTPKLGFKFRF